jgi:hypothetical protein
MLIYTNVVIIGRKGFLAKTIQQICYTDKLCETVRDKDQKEIQMTDKGTEWTHTCLLAFSQ